ncbi:MAG: peptidoglycan bridge formation glycyltransferase FemA/FemB family protein [Candidatus Acidiferrales bacterium]
MKIELNENSEQWNNAVLALRGTLYHSWEWGETRANQGWHPWRVLAQEEGTPCAAVQLFERKVPLLGASVLYAASGIAGHDAEASVVNSLAAWMGEFGVRRNAILLRIESRFDDQDESRKALLNSAGFRALTDQWSLWNLPRANMIIDISGAEEELLRRMRKKHREHINRSQRNGLKITATSEVAGLRVFYDLLLKSSERQGFAVRDFGYFIHLREQLLTGDRGLLFLAEMDSRPVAGILCAQFGSTCHYLYGGFDWTARQAYANEALHWTAIRWARKLGCDHYDMVGAGTSYPPTEGNAGYGLYNFKKGFGAELVYSAGYFDLINRRALYSALRFAETHTGWITVARGIRSAVQRVLDATGRVSGSPSNRPNRDAAFRDHPVSEVGSERTTNRR